jgi:hypothetical protein
VITALFVGFEVGFQKIGKEKQSEYQKDNDQFDDDNYP